MNNPKDPYLSELDALDDNDDLPLEDEATDVNVDQPDPALPEEELSAPQAPDADAFAVASDIPVQVVVVMGRKEIAMKDLMDLKKGNVVELSKVPNDAVDLVAGGKVIAKGELVEIDGKLGVRVLKMLK